MDYKVDFNWRLNGLHDLIEIYAELRDNMFSFVKLYQITKKEGMTPQQVIDTLKIVERIPYLQAELQYIEDCIDEDGPKIFELYKKKQSLAKEVEKYKATLAGEHYSSLLVLKDKLNQKKQSI